jgi:hypothetical protein
MKNIFLSLQIVLLITLKASACGLVYSEEAMARLVTERTLIVWNEKEKTEDFIRSPQIETNKSDIGFIVPVPNIPDVTEVDDKIFSELDQLIEERRPTEIKFWRNFSDSLGSMDGISKSTGTLGAAPGSRGVMIVKEFNLSKYEVKVVKATDLDAFKSWLQENNYAFRPAFEEWLKNYVNDRYYLTVFKFKKDQDGEGLKAQAISIKFKADAPFYPYRDSSDMQASPDRNLKLYFLSDKMFLPDFSDSKIAKPQGFNETPDFSAQVKVRAKHQKLHFNEQNWLTVWSDTTQERPNRDLTFKAASEVTEEILPDPKYIYLEDYLPLVIVGIIFVLLVGLVVLIVRFILKKLK